jgi:hypothetical protein
MVFPCVTFGYVIYRRKKCGGCCELFFKLLNLSSCLLAQTLGAVSVKTGVAVLEWGCMIWSTGSVLLTCRYILIFTYYLELLYFTV